MSFKRTPSTAVDVPDMKRVPSVGSLSTNKARHALDVVVDDVSYTVTNAKASSEPVKSRRTSILIQMALTKPRLMWAVKQNFTRTQLLVYL